MMLLLYQLLALSDCCHSLVPFKPEPFRTGRMVRSQVRPRLRTEPLQRSGVRTSEFWRRFHIEPSQLTKQNL
ncbi:uncharacterized protein EDB91DRAFT_1169730 [Suillus paluster]|uniref:uncharacterized protein n=1 Tax=Suillus paluster TaxID=48578 RepID=UPI001B865614|nr:uncharacterized protein EDB91DRAFT_1169730 [Suillus paluster]KAG1724953.1 hypothetical protein EDB91DRAFT_1169730 [Suillus paluster]